ncbi:MAG: transcriptional regulator [Candidatus Odinarchaeota archaeon]
MKTGKEGSTKQEAYSELVGFGSQRVIKDDILDVQKTLTEFSNLIVNTKVIFEPYRFTIMLLLYKYKKLMVNELQMLLDITSGNLDHHIRKLKKEGYVKKHKILSWRLLNAVEITDEGTEIFSYYLHIFRRKFTEIMRWIGDDTETEKNNCSEN